ncbi:MAG: terminase family protein [Planctomycetia bacterium]|nr:terminase family protein [Planctomycetia bacterium]
MIRPFIPHPKQTAFYKTLLLPLERRPKIILADCGRGSGKTEIAYRFTSRELMVEHPLTPTPIYAHILPTYKQAKEVVFDKYQAIIPKELLKKRPSQSELRFDTIFGSILYVTGADKPERLEGKQYAGVVVDEACDHHPRLIDLILLPACSHFNAWILCVGVPKRIGKGAATFHKMCKDADRCTDGTMAHFHWTSEEIVSERELAIARRKLSPEDYREQYLATWENASGLVYYAFSEQNLFDDNRYDPKEPLLISSDFNVNPMAWVVCQGKYRGYKKELRVLDEIVLKNSCTEQALQYLFERWGHHPSGFEFYGDATGQSNHTNSRNTDYILIQNDRRFTKPGRGITDVFYPKGNPNVLDRVAAVNAMLHNAAGEIRLKISTRCKHLIEDLENVAYREHDRVIDKSDPRRTHISDALGYLVNYRYPMSTRVSSKSNTITYVARH